MSGSTTAYATTKASYYKVDSVEVTYCTNGSAGAGGIKVSVGGTKIDSVGVAYTSGTGTDPKVIKFKPATPLTGNVMIYGKGKTNSIYIGAVKIYYRTFGYKDYMTSCCDDVVTIGAPTITGSGTVTFASGGETLTEGDVVETCTAAKTITATVTPAAGYSCTALSFTDGSSALTTSPTILSSVPFDAPTAKDYDMTFVQNTTSMTLTTSATFTAKPLTGWAWKYKKDADAADGSVDPYDIPSTVEIYKDQYARFIITGYTPSDVIATKQGYVYDNDSETKEPQYDRDLLAFVSKNGSAPWQYFQLRGKAPTESTTITFKATGDASVTKTITIRVKDLPVVHFVDNVHNVSFDDVVATVSTGVVTFTKNTPTHDDVAMPVSGNECEQQHLHLIGWIRSDYDKVEDYMDGSGSKPTESQIISAGQDANDLAYFLAPNASINVEDYNGFTFYAVWAKVE